MLKCSFPMTASVQESLENHFKEHPIPIKPSAEFISKIAVSTSVFENLNPGKARTRFKVPITNYQSVFY